MEKMSDVIKGLENVFDLANKYFYNGELVKPVITVQTGRRNILGWCSTTERWNSGTEKAYEINIVAENLGRTKEQIIGTMLHECVHLYNCQRGVKDCSGAQYHNKEFKNVAESHGLKTERVRNRGYAKTELNENGIEFSKTVSLNFDVSRMHVSGKRGYNKPVTYECPGCHRRIRFHNDRLNAICGDCNQRFSQIG